MEFVPQFYANEYKLNPDRLQALSQKMLELIEKWQNIIVNADIQSAEDLREVYWEEVYSKIDPAQYSPKR